MKISRRKQASDIEPPEPWPEPGEGKGLVTPKPALARIVGNEALPRTKIVKKLWSYVKKNGLQDKKNKRMINTDARLKAVVGNKRSVSLNEMTELIHKHLT